MTTDPTAQSAPTPAPVAVPERGWRDGDSVVHQRDGFGFFVLERDAGAWHGPRGLWRSDDDIAQAIEYGRIAAVGLAPRPEPVVAPLPSEAVERAAEAMYEADRGRHQPHWSGALDHHREPFRVMARAALPHFRPVLEDDEDTVRVPRVALIELNAAVMERRDLVDAIEEFNDEVRG